MSSKNGQKVDIYTDLDVLMDMRLATLHRMDPALAEKVLNNNYHKRDSDFFEGVDSLAYSQMYRERDSDTLRFAYATEAFKLIKRIAGQIVEQIDSRPYYSGSRIVVNHYPYKIHPDILEDIVLAIRVRTGDLLPVVLINAPEKEITPSRAKDDFGVMILYDAESWMNTHMRALENCPIPEIILFTPAMFHRMKPSPETLAQTIEESCHPFIAMPKMFEPLINIEMIEVANFCVIMSEQPPQQTSAEATVGDAA